MHRFEDKKGQSLGNIKKYGGKDGLKEVLFRAVRVAGQILVENYEKLSEKDVIVKKRNDYVTLSLIHISEPTRPY